MTLPLRRSCVAVAIRLLRQSRYPVRLFIGSWENYEDPIPAAVRIAYWYQMTNMDSLAMCYITIPNLERSQESGRMLLE
jgi:hypothetical protein